jgi:thymidylate kinase
MTVNRYEDAKEMTEQLRQGIVVCDRFSPSSRVYGRINDLPAAFLDGIQERLPQPDVCILIDIPVSEARRRRSDLLDRYEEMDDMQERARSEYLQLFRNNGWHVVDGTESYETVQRRVRECIPQAMALREQD